MLDFSTIEAITSGAVKISKEDDGYHFFRFTSEQLLLYKQTKPVFYSKALCTSGIKLQFRTNSKNLKLGVLTVAGTARTYFSFDVCLNGKLFDSLDNFSDNPIPENYTTEQFPLGEFQKVFALPEGDKLVTIYFPWAVCAVLQELALDDDAYITPVKPGCKLLCFGDSITQGYDALHPSNRYASAIADALDAEEFNKAIGGERFFPELAEIKESFAPDLITVAYGTNDWSSSSKDQLETSCRKFYENISKNYPDVPIFALSPIWRKDADKVNDIGDFSSVEKIICNATRDLKNVRVISGVNFVPHDESFFADGRLHPNDRGFSYYVDGLLQQLKTYVSE